jgi:hypothetical protein
MSKQDQLDVVTNQAVATIVCCYLEHMNTAITKGIQGATTTGGAGTSTAFISTAELVTLINDVQGALRTV